MIADHRHNYLKNIRYFANIISYPIYYIASLPAHAWTIVYQNYSSRDELAQENQTLHQQNIKLALEVKKYSNLLEENRHLKKLLKASQDYADNRTILAKVVNKKSTPFKQRIVLNKGTHDNLYIGQPILGAKGILGQITSVTPFSSIGMLITDPGHQMLARVKRPQTLVFIAGTGNPDQLELRNRSVNVKIQKGDVIVTTGLDETYPANYPIGTVTEIDKSSSHNLARILVKPFAQLSQGHEVLLVWNQQAKKTNTDNSSHSSNE